MTEIQEKEYLLFIYQKIINRYPLSVAQFQEYKKLIKKYPNYLHGGKYENTRT